MKKLARPQGANAAAPSSGLRTSAPRGSLLALGIAMSGVYACGGAAVGPDGADLSGNERDVEITHDACNGDSGSAKRVDVNQDGKPDITHVMSGGREVCRIVDLNFDGRVDAFIYFDAAGKERRRESDFDRDGRADEIAIYQGGVLVQKLRETNFDGKLDTWDTYSGGKLVRRERDSDADAIIDQWWEFNSDDTRCAIVSSDKNTDGKPDPDTVVDLCADPNAPVRTAQAAPPPSPAAPAAPSAAPSAPAPPPSTSAPAPAPPAASTPPATPAPPASGKAP